MLCKKPIVNCQLNIHNATKIMIHFNSISSSQLKANGHSPCHKNNDTLHHYVVLPATSQWTFTVPQKSYAPQPIVFLQNISMLDIHSAIKTIILFSKIPHQIFINNYVPLDINHNNILF